MKVITPTRAISASMIFQDVLMKIFCSSVTNSMGGGPISSSLAWLTVECFLGGIGIWWSLTSESCLTIAFPIFLLSVAFLSLQEKNKRNCKCKHRQPKKYQKKTAPHDKRYSFDALNTRFCFFPSFCMYVLQKHEDICTIDPTFPRTTSKHNRIVINIAVLFGIN